MASSRQLEAAKLDVRAARAGRRPGARPVKEARREASVRDLAGARRPRR
jgi:hypothetical protein